VTIEETVKSFIEDVNAEFGSDLAIDEGEEGEIAGRGTRLGDAPKKGAGDPGAR
jgi:hypothetical protein